MQVTKFCCYQLKMDLENIFQKENNIYSTVCGAGTQMYLLAVLPYDIGNKVMINYKVNFKLMQVTKCCCYQCKMDLENIFQKENNIYSTVCGAGTLMYLLAVLPSDISNKVRINYKVNFKLMQVTKCCCYQCKMDLENIFQKENNIYSTVCGAGTLMYLSGVLPSDIGQKFVINYEVNLN